MENQLIDLKLRIQELEKENNALKGKMTLIYSNWSYDYNRFAELKEKCKRDDNDNKNVDENTILRCNSPEQLAVP